MILPPEPSLTKPIIDWATAAQRILRALRPIPGPGISIQETSNGTIFTATAKSSTAQSPAATPDFTLSDASENGTHKIQISNGTVQDSGYGGQSWTPTGMGETPYVITVSGDYGSVYLIATIDIDRDAEGKAISGIINSLTIGSTQYQPENTESSAHLTLGTWYMDTGNEDEPLDPPVLRITTGTIGIGSQIYQFCTGAHLFGPA